MMRLAFGDRRFRVAGISGTLRVGSTNLGSLRRAPAASEDAVA
jgi:hypothetical protein